MASDKLNSISPVDIDTGKFKYVQIRVYVEDPDSKEESSKLIVRGYSWAEWHGRNLFIMVLRLLPFKYSYHIKYESVHTQIRRN